MGAVGPAEQISNSTMKSSGIVSARTAWLNVYEPRRSRGRRLSTHDACFGLFMDTPGRCICSG